MGKGEQGRSIGYRQGANTHHHHSVALLHWWVAGGGRTLQPEIMRTSAGINL